MIIVRIAFEEPESAVFRVRELLNMTAKSNPCWNGADFVIRRGEHTCIEHGSYDASELLTRINSALVAQN
jgi:hypothetical protein